MKMCLSATYLQLRITSPLKLIRRYVHSLPMIPRPCPNLFRIQFDAEFDYHFISAHPNKELVFNHKPTRTLIQADLIFNLPATEQFSRTDADPSTGLLTKLFTTVNNTRGQATGQRRFIWYIGSRPDRPGFNRSVAKIREWDFDRIIPCHGDVIETGGKGIFDTVMAWHLTNTTQTST